MNLAKALGLLFAIGCGLGIFISALMYGFWPLYLAAAVIISILALSGK